MGKIFIHSFLPLVSQDLPLFVPILIFLYDRSCYCMIQYEGLDCDNVNFSYHVAFTSIFSLMALTSLIQLGMCIHAEYLRYRVRGRSEGNE